SPLATIQQYLEAILDGAMGDISDEQRRSIQRIRERLEALMTIINDWLNLASIKRGKVVGALEAVALTDLLSDLVDFMQPLAGKNKVSMRIRLPESFPAIQGDRVSLEQVFTNLISNALHYNRPCGSVSIDFMDHGDFIAVEISDTGVGIEKEYLPFLFDEFFSLALVRRRDGKRSGGSGLGLAIAKRIVEAHGGTIEVDTVPEKGSTFTVSLPKKHLSP
ncbi:MAG: HAMP domain-containing sensor histidine kinase, partial [Pseudomonadota bacterium]